MRTSFRTLLNRGFVACSTIISNALVSARPELIIVDICLINTTLSCIGTPPIFTSCNLFKSSAELSFTETTTKPLSCKISATAVASFASISPLISLPFLSLAEYLNLFIVYPFNNLITSSGCTAYS